MSVIVYSPAGLKADSWERSLWRIHGERRTHGYSFAVGLTMSSTNCAQRHPDRPCDAESRS
jgi:hypothetical protein